MPSYPKRLIEVDLPIKRIRHMRGGRSRSGMGIFFVAHLVGTEAVGGVPGGDLRGAVAGSGRWELPAGVSGRGRAAINDFAGRGDGD